jgi:hypothetical protein
VVRARTRGVSQPHPGGSVRAPPLQFTLVFGIILMAPTATARARFTITGRPHTSCCEQSPPPPPPPSHPCHLPLSHGIELLFLFLAMLLMILRLTHHVLPPSASAPQPAVSRDSRLSSIGSRFRRMHVAMRLLMCTVIILGLCRSPPRPQLHNQSSLTSLQPWSRYRICHLYRQNRRPLRARGTGIRLFRCRGTSCGPIEPGGT